MFQYVQPPAYAGFWWRFLAYLVDAALMSVVFLPLGVIVGMGLAASSGDVNSQLFPAINFGLNGFEILLMWLYYAFFESSSWQGTIGKKVVGLRVTDMNGNRTSFRRATGRYFGMILSGMICFIGWLMIAFTEKKQGLHDLLAGTLVVKGAPVTSYPEPPPPPDFGYTGGTFRG
jgi:uncharacterized RDD family membrane protein YckC